MPVTPQGDFVKRSTAEIRADLVAALREVMGLTVNTGGAGATTKLLEAALLLPLSEVEATLEDIFSQGFFESARGDNLDKILEPIGFPRDVATRSTGRVNVTLNDALDPGVEPDPYFPSGSLTFVDSGGRRYDQILDSELAGDSFRSAETGVFSENVNASQTKIAQRFVLTEEATIGHFEVLVEHVTGVPSFDVSIETDDTGNPSGILVHDDLSAVGFLPDDGVATVGHFAKSKLLQPGTYWIVFTRTAGEARFDGGVGGTADQVMVYDGAWAFDTNVEDLRIGIVGDLLVSVRARDLGVLGNVIVGSIVGVEFANATVSARWTANVADFTNDRAFAGGQNREPDALYRERVRRTLSARETASLQGIIRAVDNVPGTTNVSGIENNTDVGGTQDTLFDSDETGTGAATDLDSAGDRIAQRMVLTETQYIQHFTAKLQFDNALVVDVRIETDAAGSPSGALAASNLVFRDFDFDGTNPSSGTFDRGFVLPAGTYWLVFAWVSGDGLLDGGSGGTADQVKGDTGGGYALDANIENANVSLVGGLRTHSARIFVTGGDDDEITDAIEEVKSTGIWVEFVRPDPTEVVLSVTVEVRSGTFDGDEDTLRDLIVDYIGGTQTDGDQVNGLAVRETLIRNEIVSRLLDDDLVVGTVDVTTLRVGRRSDFPTPGDLTGTEVVNLVADVNEKFVVEDPIADIEVTIVPV